MGGAVIGSRLPSGFLLDPKVGPLIPSMVRYPVWYGTQYSTVDQEADVLTVLLLLWLCRQARVAPRDGGANQHGAPAGPRALLLVRQVWEPHHLQVI